MMTDFREMKYITGPGTCDCCGRDEPTRIKKGKNNLCLKCFNDIFEKDK